ncbi:MAG: MipA/OmpV family protein [Methyloceanibacter sp.]|nr:MipA/OmpV family protein [Methyloceanibacter sp.]
MLVGFARHVSRVCVNLTIGVVCAALVSVFVGSGAYAQASSVDGPARSETTVAKSSVGVGARVVIQPKYEGSKESTVFWAPIVLPELAQKSKKENSVYSKVRSRIVYRGLDDIRIRVFGGDKFQAGATTGWISGRSQDSADLLKGLGDIDGGLTLGAYAGYTVGAFTIDAAYIEQLTGTTAGAQYRLGIETTREISDRAEITVRAGTTFASAEFMQTYFGITPTQSRESQSGLPVYTPDGGIKDVFIAVGGSYDVSEHWVIKAGARYGRLLGEAADSPIVQTPNQLSGNVGLAYRFYWNR